MKVVTNEHIVQCDVDSTLVFECSEHHADAILVLYYGIPKFVRPHQQHLNFLMALKARGYYIRVHSHNGYRWAEEVVNALKFENIVDEVCTKPSKTIDDMPFEEWLNPRIFIPEQD